VAFKVDVTTFAIPGVKLLTSEPFKDDRGLFFEAYREHLIEQHGIPRLVQGNVSISRQHVVRGLHYQVRQPQGKLMRTVHGSTFNVAVDMREDSPTFGKHVWTLLNYPTQAFWVPPGFANGFLALRPDTTVYYECSSYHAEGFDRALFFADPVLDISWPVDPGSAFVSTKDRNAPTLFNAERVPASECAPC
jgi:dTDP-4-dehydrorhamnose 3,5-epimerase